MENKKEESSLVLKDTSSDVTQCLVAGWVTVHGSILAKKSEVAELGSHLKGSSVQLPEGLTGKIQYFPPSLSFL